MGSPFWSLLKWLHGAFYVFFETAPRGPSSGGSIKPIEIAAVLGSPKYIQGGPPSSYKWGEITPISRVITPGKPIYKAIYRGYNSIYNL